MTAASCLVAAATSALFAQAAAFQTRCHRYQPASRPLLYSSYHNSNDGVQKWRESILGWEDTGPRNNKHYHDDTLYSRNKDTIFELLLLPTPWNEITLPGQHRTVSQKGQHGIDTRGMVDMLAAARNEHYNVIGTPIIVKRADNDDDYSDSFLPILPLCEILFFNNNRKMELKCVGRAKLLSLVQTKPYPIGKCQLVMDKEWGDVYNLSETRKDIEELILQSSSSSSSKISRNKRTHRRTLRNYRRLAKYQQCLDDASKLLESPYPFPSEVLREFEAASYAATYIASSSHQQQQQQRKKEEGEGGQEKETAATGQQYRHYYRALTTTSMAERLLLALRLLMEERLR